MPAKSHDLHGNVPEKAPVALLLIDVINDLAFADGKALLKQALPMAKRLAALKRRARHCGIPSIYVNDNFGRWQSDFQKVIRHCLDEGCGKPLATLLLPDDEDYFVLKPKHSGFYSTTLELLLQALGVHTPILTGIAGNICVLFTANDAYMREYTLVVPADCVASNTVHGARLAALAASEAVAVKTPLSPRGRKAREPLLWPHCGGKCCVAQRSRDRAAQRVWRYGIMRPGRRGDAKGFACTEAIDTAVLF
jgi:nicotinamidase-related amidase